MGRDVTRFAHLIEGGVFVLNLNGCNRLGVGVDCLLQPVPWIRIVFSSRWLSAIDAAAGFKRNRAAFVAFRIFQRRFQDLGGDNFARAFVDENVITVCSPTTIVGAGPDQRPQVLFFA